MPPPTHHSTGRCTIKPRSAGDFSVRDFTDQLKAIVTKENLEAQCKEYQAKLGYFAEREFVAVFRKETDAAIFWKQNYTKSNGEHIAFLRLISINGKILVQNVSVT